MQANYVACAGAGPSGGSFGFICCRQEGRVAPTALNLTHLKLHPFAQISGIGIYLAYLRAPTLAFDKHFKFIF